MCAIVHMLGMFCLCGMCAFVTLVTFIFRCLGLIVWGIILLAMLH